MPAIAASQIAGAGDEVFACSWCHIGNYHQVTIEPGGDDVNPNYPKEREADGQALISTHFMGCSSSRCRPTGWSLSCAKIQAGTFLSEASGFWHAETLTGRCYSEA